MSLPALLGLITAWLAAVASPGPDLVQIIRTGTHSRRAGVCCALGIMVGNTIWIIASLAGLSALINTTPQVLHVLQLVGGAFLMWMGYSSIRGGVATRRRAARVVAEHGPSVTSTPGAGTAASTSAGPGTWQALRAGVLTNLANPKAVLFFGAVFAQFVRPGMGLGFSALLAVVMIVIGLAWFIGVALAVRGLASKLLRNSALIDIAAGVVFLLLGAVMVYEGAAGFLG